MNDEIDSLMLVYDADAGLGAMLLDVVKKAVGREDCALCEITYSPLGKRRAWKACQARLGLEVRELHRNELPPRWRGDLPCVLARAGAGDPFILVRRDEIAACGGSPEALEGRIRKALADRRRAS
jgi:hypothetical protein